MNSFTFGIDTAIPMGFPSASATRTVRGSNIAFKSRTANSRSALLIGMKPHSLSSVLLKSSRTISSSRRTSAR